MRKVISATEGHILTDGYIYGRVIYLAEGAQGEEFYEITAEEYNAVMSEDDASEEDYHTALFKMG